MFTFKVIDSSVNMKNGSFVAHKSLIADTRVEDAIKTFKKDNDTCFVRVNKDFFKEASKTALSKGFYNQDRESIAIVRGYNKTDIKVRTYYANSHNISDVKKVPVCYMEKLTLDCTDEESIQELVNMGVIDSKLVGLVANKESIYVYNKVDGEDIMYILKPIEVDLLYALTKEYGLNDNNINAFVRMLAPRISLNIDDYYFTESEKVLFNAMFVDNKNLTTILYEILASNKINVDMIRLEDDSFVTVPDITRDLMLVNNQDTVDPLNIYSYLMSKKRIIIKKILSSIGCELDSISIVEDELKVSRMYDVFLNDEVELEYNGASLVVPKQSYDMRYCRNANYSLSKVADFNAKNDLTEDNLILLRNAFDRENKLNKKLNKTPNN